MKLKNLFLILIPLFILFCYSASSKILFLGSFEIEKYDWIVTVKESLVLDSNKTIVASANANREIKQPMNINTTLAGKKNQAETSTYQPTKQKKSIMIIGDSMAQGLQPHFNKLSKENNISIYTQYKVGSSSFFWSKNQQIINDINTKQPSVVLIVLGANEWTGNSNPKLKRAIKKLINDIQATNKQYIWIGPPIKNADKYYKMLNEIADPRYVYDYTDLKVGRSRDKIHPDWKGFSKWSKMIFSRLDKEGLIDDN